MENQKGKKNPPEKNGKEIEFEKLSIFFDKYIYNGKLITKNANLFGVQRIIYIKGKDFKQFFTQNFEEIKNEILTILNIDIGKEANKDSIQKFYQLNQKRNILHYLQRVPGDKSKYPKRLLPLKKGDDLNLELNFSETGFYLLNIKVEKSKKTIIYLIFLVIFILLIVLFPVWPLKMKLGVLYFLLSLIVFLIVLLILLIIIPIIGFIFGYDILIMKNFEDLKLSWKDRIFNPFIEIQGREDPFLLKFIRIVLIISLLMMGVIAYLEPTIPKESFKMIKNVFVSLYSYATKKIEDIHYNRNAIKVKNTKYLDDLNDI